jgi:glucose/mannose-6-phosphate isomerase
MNIQEKQRKYDPSDQFSVLINSYRQIEYAWGNKVDLSSIKRTFNKIIVSGLGGSAIGADLVKQFAGTSLKIPFFVNRNYSLPPYADKETLVIISSYSGNTEETVSVLDQAVKLGVQIICITTGGRVEEIAAGKKLAVIKLQKGFQPRYALGLGFFSILKILHILKLIPDQDNIVNTIQTIWKDRGAEYSSGKNTAYFLAQKLIGFIPIIYSAEDITSAAGYRFKCQFNENSKIHAFHNVIPELNHNEIIGWETFADKQVNAKLINILDPVYPDQIKKRFTITSELARKNGVEIIDLQSPKEDFQTRLMDLIYLCDWITYYTAILRGIDPTEIRNINILKERLA